ncbi:RTC4-like domain-containing protein [Xylaria intraflava]|nr:RTC4-like domain-containing protein [Xylaria intraflava]
MAGAGSKAKAPRLGLTRHNPWGPPLTQVEGRNILHSSSAKRPKVESSDSMKGDQDPLYDPITAPPESSDDEVENAPVEQAVLNDQDSDEEYERRQTADIRKTTFNKSTVSKIASTRPTRPVRPVIRVPRTIPGSNRRSLLGSEIDGPSSLAGSKRPAEEDQPTEDSQPGKDLEALRQKKKKLVTKYGSNNKAARQNVFQSRSFDSKHDATSSASDKAQPISTLKPFKHAGSLSPERGLSPRRPFKTKRQDSDSDQLESSKPSFKKVPERSLSPDSTPEKRKLRHLSPLDEPTERDVSSSLNRGAKGLRNRHGLSRRKSAKGRKSLPDSKTEELSQRPVFKMPGLDDFDSFDDTDSLDAADIPGTLDTTWDDLEIEETESANIPRCPICHEEVDRELLEKHSANGKMSIKQQTAFCRLHKRQSAINVGTDKGYPKIDWEGLANRCSAHQAFLQNILEGTQASHYREILKSKVDSGKNRTLLTSNDNFTPGYYGPRGLQVMTEYIMRTLTSVIRRRAVEDKLISARSYTGYVQIVLVPELAVRLVMEDMSVSEERAREVLEESAEIGELLHEEDRDVVRIQEEQDVVL